MLEHRQRAGTFPTRHWYSKLAGKKEPDPLYSRWEHNAPCDVYVSPTSDAVWCGLHANLQTRFFSSPSVANVHICFKVGSVCPWVVFDLEEINPSGDSQKNKGGLTHSVLGQGTDACARFTYPEEEVKDEE